MDQESSDQTEGTSRNNQGMNRRRFMKLAVAGIGTVGAAAVGVGALTGRLPLPSFAGSGGRCSPPKTFTFQNRAFVDYSTVDKKVCDTTFRIAQWYDYWPGSFLENFKNYVRDKYGIAIDIVQDIYDSNEELLNWITLGGKKYDVMFPTNYMVELMDSLGLVYNLNLDWIPNYQDMFLEFRPTDATRLPHQWRVIDANADIHGLLPVPAGLNDRQYLRAVPYQWGTTGIGFNQDFIDRGDIEAAGFDAFTWNTYQLKGGGVIDFKSDKKMTLLNDMREVLSVGMKLAGWHKQDIVEHLSPKTGIPADIPDGVWLTEKVTFNTDPDAKDDPVWPRQIGSALPQLTKHPITDPAIFKSNYKDKGYQWSHNETDDSKLDAVKAELLAIKPRLYAFETAQQAPFLARKVSYIAHGWMGDFLYQARPYMEVGKGRQPIDYVIPKQGSARWMDNCCIPSSATNIWLANEFINFIHDTKQQTLITDWNLYGTPNEKAFAQLTTFNELSEPYDPRKDSRIYSDQAVGYDPNANPEGHILMRCDYQRDVGAAIVQGNYFPLFSSVKY